VRIFVTKHTLKSQLSCNFSLIFFYIIVCVFFNILIFLLKHAEGVIVLLGLSWPWSYGSWIYNYLCTQCLSPLKLWVRIPLMARCIRYNIIYMWWSLSVTYDRSVVFYGYSSFLHQQSWPPWYSWNIFESGVKQQKSINQSYWPSRWHLMIYNVYCLLALSCHKHNSDIMFTLCQTTF